MRHVVFSKLEKRKDVQLELWLNTGEAVLEVASVSMSIGQRGTRSSKVDDWVV
jgi:hypothetical protein